jgi:hypothetical protein
METNLRSNVLAMMLERVDKIRIYLRIGAAEGVGGKDFLYIPALMDL